MLTSLILGAVLGLTGAGGGILAVPALVAGLANAAGNAGRAGRHA